MVSKTLFSIDPTPEEDDYDSKAAIGSSFWGDNSVRDAVPWPGSTYIIVDRAGGRAITMIDGRLSLETDACATGSATWVCIENKGWFGFRNTASGKYMGHDGRKNIYAVKNHHQAWEFFIARPCPDGGYLLLTTHYDLLLKMRIGDDGRSLVAREDGGSVWEFIKV
jgi:hypothetical protein